MSDSPRMANAKIIAATIAAAAAIGSAFIATRSSQNAQDSSQNAQKASAEVQSKKELPVGTVVSSMLPPHKFYEEVDGKDYDKDKKTWVIADGEEDIAGSKYYDITGKTVPPNLLGQFIRGMNYKQRGVDPNNTRKVGGDQEDKINSHIHKYSDLLGAVNGKGQTVEYGKHDSTHTSIKRETYPNVDASTETRPKNIALYMYIKVR